MTTNHTRLNDEIDQGFRMTRDEGMRGAVEQLKLLFGRVPEPASAGPAFIRLTAVWKTKKENGPKGKQIENWYPASLKEACDLVPTLFDWNDNGYDIYVGVNPRKEESGTKASTFRIRNIHTEVDVTAGLSFEDIDHKVKGFPLPPLMWVVSGPTGGKHVYLRATEELAPDLAEALSRGLGLALSAKDNVHDCSRLLRLAGTLNTKPEYADLPPFRAVLVVGDREAMYTPEDLGKVLLPPEPAPCHAESLSTTDGPGTPESCGGEPAKEAKKSAPEAGQVPGWFVHLMGQDPSLSTAWNRKGPKIALDASDADHHLLCEVLGARPETTDRELKELLVAFRCTHNDRPEKAGRADYVDSTITAARQAWASGFVVSKPGGSVPPNWLRSMSELEEDLGGATSVQWLVEGILTKGSLGILGAFPKHFKSVFLCDLAVSVATGTPFLGEFPVAQAGRVIFISAEDSIATVYSRLKRIAAARGVADPKDLDIHVSCRSGLQLSQPHWCEKLLSKVQELAPALIIIDPLRAAFGGDENDSLAARQVAETTLPLRECCNASVFFAHHYRKNNDSSAGSSPGSRLRGSGDWHASAETLVGLAGKGKKEDGRYSITLSAELREAAGVDRMEFVVEFGEEQIAITKAKGSGSALYWKIIDVAKKAGEEGLSKNEIASAVPGNRKEVLWLIRRLVEKDQLVPVSGQGGKKKGTKYVLPDPEADFDEVWEGFSESDQHDEE